MPHRRFISFFLSALLCGASLLHTALHSLCCSAPSEFAVSQNDSGVSALFERADSHHAALHPDLYCMICAGMTLQAALPDNSMETPCSSPEPHVRSGAEHAGSALPVPLHRPRGPPRVQGL